MADNIAITAGSGTTVATDDIAGVQHQRVKISLGADGVANDAVAGAGAVGTGVQRVTLASDDPAVVALQILDNAIAGSEMQVDVVTMPAIDISDDFTREIGLVKVANSGGTAVDPIGPSTGKKFLDVDETEEEVKATAGTLYWVHAINLSNAKRYLKFYNATTGDTTVGTTTPLLTFPIPTMGDTNGAGFNLSFGAGGVSFSAAITIAATTGFADNDTGAPGANEIIVNLGYA